ncbi:class D beta-lactamase [Pseudoteredinibacter isoporae]|uniref:Beta-lactamase n=1 Tax=Pseudoteredinibacter isoporae TaxID=570281 RepID=A0A7X0MX59_9GAMM|nr:class D beta-lactamase [Pseudoteredinibacter isoporae]MBB6523381.1 beta-lactamase class D [Pseudoteredinibacter isoporae]NHO88893.1 class D beta-lactamase [Pseudoteredinibacter isoporae]NIB24399.1 class D beta-lactamase [Pseudoteredinibacter isoporae]
MLKSKGLFCLFAVLHSVALTVNAQMADTACGERCSFVLLNEEDGKFQFVNQQRAETRFTPFSSFKIANTLIALETGQLKDLSQTFSVNKEAYPVESWWPKRWYEAPLTIREAFHASALPIYRQLAVDIGDTDMTRVLNGFQYGNGDISSGLDSFWLNGSLQISAVEQVCFLRRLARRELPLSANSFAMFEDIMEVDLDKEPSWFAEAFKQQSGDVKLFAKTGGGPLSNEKYIGWYVGYVQNAEGNHYFALNMEADSFRSIQGARKAKVLQQLKDFNVLK